MQTYLSSADASRVLNVTTATVRLMVRRGDLTPAAKTEGGIHLFHRHEVERLAAERKARTTERARLGA
jgi:DNA-binding transcriptional MerR regulator